MSTPENFSTPSPSAVAGPGVDWEARYQSHDTPWDKGCAAPPLIEWLETNDLCGKVLVPGCGSGHDVRAIANSGVETVIGLDLAPSAIDSAGNQPRVGSERYRLANFLSLPPELVGAFDWVFEHTCFCAIDPTLRATYVRAVAAALVPGGHLLAIFYLDVGERDGGPPFGTTREELDDLFGATFETLTESVPTRSYEGREGCELLRVLRLR